MKIQLNMLINIIIYIICFVIYKFLKIEECIYLLYSLLAIIIHELGHICLAILFKIKIIRIKFIPLGFEADIDEGITKLNKLVLFYLGGSLFNFLIILILLLLKKLCLDFIIINFIIGFLNLLPIFPLDGGRIVFEIMSYYYGYRKGSKFTFNISNCILFFSIILSLYYSVNNKCIPFFLLIQIFLFINIIKSKKMVNILNIKNILSRKEKMLKKQIYPVKYISVFGDLTIGQIVKSLDYNCFYMIHILDKDLNIICTVSEKDILSTFVKYSSSRTIESIFINKT